MLLLPGYLPDEPDDAVRVFDLLWRALGVDLSKEILQELQGILTGRRIEFLNALLPTIEHMHRQNVMNTAQEASLSMTSSVTNSGGTSTTASLTNSAGSSAIEGDISTASGTVQSVVDEAVDSVNST